MHLWSSEWIKLWFFLSKRTSKVPFFLSSWNLWKALSMGYVQEARENHVKKKVEEGKQHPLT